MMLAAAHIPLSNLTRRIVDPRDAEIERLRDRVDELEAALGISDIHPGALRPKVAKFFGLLLKREFVTHDAMRLAVGGDVSSEHYLGTYVCIARKLLGPKLRDAIQTRWGAGAFIATKDKAKVRAFIEGLK